MLFAAHGRTVLDETLFAYLVAVRERTDYQVERAADFLVRNHTGDFPPTGAQLNERASRYELSKAREIARVEYNRREIERARMGALTHNTKPVAESNEL